MDPNNLTDMNPSHLERIIGAYGPEVIRVCDSFSLPPGGGGGGGVGLKWRERISLHQGILEADSMLSLEVDCAPS